MKSNRALWKRLSESLADFDVSEQDISSAAGEFHRMYEESAGVSRRGLVGLGKMQWKCLNTLFEHKGCHTASQVNRLINDELNITRLALNGLMKRNIVDRVRDSDRRHYQNLYFITEYGESLLKDKR
tara:strand:+ start:351 stop:731 length:381 start_codon:yes stop_codon:yes gene_type:complete